MHKVPTLTVIAGRPAGSRPYEETHRTARGLSDVVADFLESFIGAVFAGLCILALAWGTAALILSLEVR